MPIVLLPFALIFTVPALAIRLIFLNNARPLLFAIAGAGYAIALMAIPDMSLMDRHNPADWVVATIAGAAGGYVWGRMEKVAPEAPCAEFKKV
ncbi:hypothetical protein MWU61_08455 [Loktanella sp. F6476L]|nr:hypothetical protein [Loktanella sp. F6476L]